ncbi:MAG: DUF2007 domain-containing protein [Polaribacter sp.]
MSTELINVFTETLIIVKGLKNILDEKNISSSIKNHPEMARLTGFGSTQNSVELYIHKNDLKIAQPIIETYKTKINS